MNNITFLGLGNIAFDSNDDSFLLSTTKKALLKFKKTENPKTMTEDWFDTCELLSDIEFEKLLNQLGI